MGPGIDNRVPFNFRNPRIIHVLHYITLHYITLHYITLHYITVHYIFYSGLSKKKLLGPLAFAHQSVNVQTFRRILVCPSFGDQPAFRLLENAQYEFPENQVTAILRSCVKPLCSTFTKTRRRTHTIYQLR